MWESRIQFTIGVVALSGIGIALGLISVISPHWGKFVNYKAYTFGAGILAAIGLCLQGITVVTIVSTLLMMHSKSSILCGYRLNVWFQFVVSAFSSICSISSAILFAFQGDALTLGFTVRRDWAFHIQIVVILIYFAVFLCCVVILHWFRTLGGDPTLYHRDPEGKFANTVRNPSFRSSATKSNGHMTSDVTDAVPRSIILSNGTPLKSSLKKKNVIEMNGLTLGNPGFSQQSPTLSRTGSGKKVRIHTQCTEV